MKGPETVINEKRPYIPLIFYYQEAGWENSAAKHMLPFMKKGKMTQRVEPIAQGVESRDMGELSPGLET